MSDSKITVWKNTSMKRVRTDSPLRLLFRRQKSTSDLKAKNCSLKLAGRVCVFHGWGERDKGVRKRRSGGVGRAGREVGDEKKEEDKVDHADQGSER